jgi:chaperonin cofactor prefoldin
MMFKFASSIGFACVLELSGIIAISNAYDGDRRDDDRKAIELVRVQLFPAGQGVFEFNVPLDGEQKLQLWLTEFERDDLLKTLVSSQLETIRVEFPTEVSRDIPAFQQLVQDPSTTLAEFLQGLRGQSISLRTLGETWQGTLIGVESSMQTVGQQTLPIELVCLNTAHGLIRVPLDSQSVVSLTSPELQSRLDRILARKQGKTLDRLPVTLSIKRNDSKQGKFAFAIETAPWKCAYRLVSSENLNDLQASAIIDNTSSLDWNEVEVVLVVDQLLGFHAPLSRIADWGRDSMSIPAPFSAAPPMLTAGVRRRIANAIVDNPIQPNGIGIGGMGGMGGGMGGMGGMGGGGGGASQELRHDQRLGITFSTEDLQHASYGQRVHISLPTVTLASGESTTLFLPKLPQRIDEVRVYSEPIHKKHPLSAFQVTLQEEYQLPGGPGAVWRSNGYSGDVMIPRLVSGVPQLVTYAVDGLIEIRHEIPDPGSDVSLPSTWHWNDDELIETAKWERVHHYRIQNDGQKSALLFVEHRVDDYDWIPVRNDAFVETQGTDEYRYRMRVAPVRDEDFQVTEQRSKQIVWSSKTNVADMRLKLKDATLDPIARKSLQQWITSIEREKSYVFKKERINRELNEAAQDQRRIKELLTAVPREDELYKRYLDKLSTLENEIDALRKSLNEVNSQFDALRGTADKMPPQPSEGR